MKRASGVTAAPRVKSGEGAGSKPGLSPNKSFPELGTRALEAEELSGPPTHHEDEGPQTLCHRLSKQPVADVEHLPAAGHQLLLSTHGSGVGLWWVSEAEWCRKQWPGAPWRPAPYRPSQAGSARSPGHARGLWRWRGGHHPPPSLGRCRDAGEGSWCGKPGWVWGAWRVGWSSGASEEGCHWSERLRGFESWLWPGDIACGDRS